MGVLIFDMDQEIVEEESDEVLVLPPRKEERPMLDLELEIVPLEKTIP